MNYKVLKRPMFRIGGGVDSQGTGITSGMDMPRKNFGHGGPHDYDYWSEKVPEAFESMRSVLGPATLIKGAEALRNVGSIWDIPGALGSPEMLGAVGTGLVTDKKLDLQEAKTMAKLTKPASSFGEKVYQMKRRHLAIINQKIKDIRDGKMEGDISELEEQKLLIFSGFETEAKIRAQIADDFYEANGTYPSKDYVDKQLEKRKQALEGNAAGGMPNRVNRVGLQESFPGTVGEGQNVMQGEGAAVMEQNMQGMTTGQNQAMTQDPYQILRRRLPPEVSDDVVRLIAYNKEAFQDFANIQTQDDVTMFNDKWGVQLVVDVGSA